jgi:allantoinase
MRLIVEAQARGVNVSCETCPHYLLFTEEDMYELGALAKCSPPLRPLNEQQELWEHLRGGDISFVASDHSPAPPELKHADDFFAVWGGIAGCQTLLPTLLTAGYARRRLPLTTIAELTSEAVARRFQLLPHKGQIAVGYDADLTLIDLDAMWQLDTAAMHYRHAQSPFVDQQFQGRIVRTMVRGITVYQDGKIVAPGGTGRLVRPTH